MWDCWRESGIGSKQHEGFTVYDFKDEGTKRI